MQLSSFRNQDMLREKEPILYLVVSGDERKSVSTWLLKKKCLISCFWHRLLAYFSVLLQSLDNNQRTINLVIPRFWSFSAVTKRLRMGFWKIYFITNSFRQLTLHKTDRVPFVQRHETQAIYQRQHAYSGWEDAGNYCDYEPWISLLRCWGKKR